MGMNEFAPYISKAQCFVVRNIGISPKKTIRIFQYPIQYGDERDLLKIPGVGESDIRASLLKGELNHKIRASEIIITCSDIDLLQFNNGQKLFLQNVGIINGLEVGSGQITSELNNRIDGGGEVVGTYVTAELSLQSSDALVRTTTSGKIFNCTSIVISISNSSTNIAGALNIMNGGSDGTILIPISLASSSTQFTSQISMSLNFPTPLQFATDTFIKIVSGVLIYSITVVGYEV